MSCQYVLIQSSLLEMSFPTKQIKMPFFPLIYMTVQFKCSSNVKSELGLASLRGTAVSKSLLVLLA